MSKPATRLGLIADTHGLLRLEALAALANSDLIIHAGDIGSPTVLAELQKLSPVIAIKGNIDRAGWAASLPATATVDFASQKLYVLHDVHEIDFDPLTAGFQFVISGHSHQPGQTERGGVCYLNPGSAGPRRFRLPITVARMDFSQSPPAIGFVDLNSQTSTR